MVLDNLRAKEAQLSLETSSVKEVAVAEALNAAAERRNALELEWAQSLEKSTAALRDRLRAQKELDEYSAAGIEASRSALNIQSGPYR